MMSYKDFFVLLLSSSLVSSIISTLLNIYIGNKRQYSYNESLIKLENKLAKDLEIVKINQTNNKEIQQGFARRKVDNYPSFIDLTYRIRNEAFMISGLKKIEEEQIAAFRKLHIAFEDLLYFYRLDLERDQLFEPIHDFKYLTKTFYSQAEKLLFLSKEQYQMDISSEVRQQESHSLIITCHQINALYSEIVEKFSKILNPIT